MNRLVPQRWEHAGHQVILPLFQLEYWKSQSWNHIPVPVVPTGCTTYVIGWFYFHYPPPFHHPVCQFQLEIRPQILQRLSLLFDSITLSMVGSNPNWGVKYICNTKLLVYGGKLVGQLSKILCCKDRVQVKLPHLHHWCRKLFTVLMSYLLSTSATWKYLIAFVLWLFFQDWTIGRNLSGQ